MAAAEFNTTIKTVNKVPARDAQFGFLSGNQKSRVVRDDVAAQPENLLQNSQLISDTVRLIGNESQVRPGDSLRRSAIHEPGIVQERVRQFQVLEASQILERNKNAATVSPTNLSETAVKNFSDKGGDVKDPHPLLPGSKSQMGESIQDNAQTQDLRHDDASSSLESVTFTHNSYLKPHSTLEPVLDKEEEMKPPCKQSEKILQGNNAICTDVWIDKKEEPGRPTYKSSVVSENLFTDLETVSKLVCERRRSINSENDKDSWHTALENRGTEGESESFTRNVEGKLQQNTEGPLRNTFADLSLPPRDIAGETVVHAGQREIHELEDYPSVSTLALQATKHVASVEEERSELEGDRNHPLRLLSEQISPPLIHFSEHVQDHPPRLLAEQTSSPLLHFSPHHHLQVISEVPPDITRNSPQSTKPNPLSQNSRTMIVNALLAVFAAFAISSLFSVFLSGGAIAQSQEANEPVPIDGPMATWLAVSVIVLIISCLGILFCILFKNGYCISLQETLGCYDTRFMQGIQAERAREDTELAILPPPALQAPPRGARRAASVGFPDGHSSRRGLKDTPQRRHSMPLKLDTVASFETNSTRVSPEFRSLYSPTAAQELTQAAESSAGGSENGLSIPEPSLTPPPKVHARPRVDSQGAISVRSFV